VNGGPHNPSKIFSQEASAKICERRSKYFLEYFLRRLQRRSVNGGPHNPSKIFSQEASLTICGRRSKYFLEYFLRRLQRRSVIRSSSSYQISLLKYFRRRLQRRSVIRSSSSYQISLLKYFIRCGPCPQLMRDPLGIPNTRGFGGDL